MQLNAPLTTHTTQLKRCRWCGESSLYQHYHDEEWGLPQHNAQMLFEMLCLEGQQAGLSWITVLKKRPHYRQCFYDFDVQKVAQMTDEQLLELVKDAGLIRHIGKLRAIRSNAHAWLAAEASGINMVDWLWSFVEGQPQINHIIDYTDAPAKTATSHALSVALKKLGFKFVGDTTCYAFMQAVGMVNDHEQSCFRQLKYRTLLKPTV
jgi:DNA-3-methyladenine glycosylase I